MAPIGLILWVFAFVLFVLAATLWAIPDPTTELRRYRIMAAGLACIALAEIIGRAGPLFVGR